MNMTFERNTGGASNPPSRGLPPSPNLHNFQRLASWIGGIALALTVGSAACAADRTISIDSDFPKGRLDVLYKGRKLLSYAFAENQSKPYVRELYTLRGENVLRDAPPDHLHHHGIMYAFWVNGINFWEEKSDSGVEKHVEIPLYYAIATTNGVPTARFQEVIHWVPPAKRKAADSLEAALLVEDRTLTLTVNETNQEVALLWESQFKVGPNTPKVTLTGVNYDGVGLRLPQTFNHAAKFQNSAGLPYRGPNTQNVIPANWTSVAGQIDGRDVMLVMFGRTENQGGEARFFTMVDPFAYLCATQGLDKQPLEYGEGAKFSLSYLLTVYSGTKSPTFIARRADVWEKERK
jgi:hypothetical protein